METVKDKTEEIEKMKSEFIHAYYLFSKERRKEDLEKMLGLHWKIFKLSGGKVPLSMFKFIQVLKEDFRIDRISKRNSK
ncbi:hypothetical protein [Alkalibacillus haloalkaliphilus]|uniref:Uncharacterized protein n=1 Tax=Alkalibacillus haloalkaliphilus TaxID=94136 RepID=A0A511W8I6_9BACI|nr:hypothetical protein [Alkalibacillus haloalkaliphilus]GEN46658.1 hypothetical protein AHA02nite_24340 [Alkalibacillus haloalkaliphilus]